MLVVWAGTDPPAPAIPRPAQVFMLPADRPVDEACLQDILSRGHSRVPVYEGGQRGAITGLLLAKELVLVDPGEGATIGQLPMRPLPRLSAATPLYDMLKVRGARCVCI